MHEDIWRKCLEDISKNISNHSYKTWFDPIKPLALNGHVLTVQVPSMFFYEWIEDNYIQFIMEALSLQLGEDAKLKYSIKLDNTDKKSNSPNTLLDSQKIRTQSKIEAKELDDQKLLEKNYEFNPNYRFDNFVEGESNRLARTAGLTIAEKPGTTSFNPLMIYGGVGLGKTHLVQSIGSKIKENFPEKKVVYVPSEKFVNQFIDYLKRNEVQKFIAFYQGLDVFILDDVQFLKNKERTQEFFFHIFNHLHQSGKQILMTSDSPPVELRGLQERLISRFKWGLTTDLQFPSPEMRKEIIEAKLEEDGVEIDDETISFITHSVNTSIRDLQGVVVSLIAHASLLKAKIDITLAKRILSNIVKEPSNEIGIDYIQKTVSDYFRIEPNRLKAKTRKKEIVIARQIAMYFSKDYTNYSLKSIGYYFGGRDHSTVIHALQSVDNMLTTDKRFKNILEEISNKIRKGINV